MKWDLSNVSTLYLVAITTSRDIRCLRDLRKQHLPMLRGIRKQASTVVHEKWKLKPDNLRFYIHYQPSYCTQFTVDSIGKILLIHYPRSLSRSHRQFKLRRLRRYGGRTSSLTGRCDFNGAFIWERMWKYINDEFSSNATPIFLDRLYLSA